MRPQLDPELEVKQRLDEFAEYLRQADCPDQSLSPNDALTEMNDAHEITRKGKTSNGQHLGASMYIPEFAEHYRTTAEALEACRRLIATLKTHGYWDHCGL